MKLIITIVLLIIGGIIWAWNREKRDWNKGICRECGKKWRWFDNDSQGGRGYTDENDHTIWISYPFIDNLPTPKPASQRGEPKVKGK